MVQEGFQNVYSGNFIYVKLMVERLKNIGINPIVKDETESGRLAGFGASIQNFQELYVHSDELDKAMPIINQVKSELESR